MRRGIEAVLGALLGVLVVALLAGCEADSAAPPAEQQMPDCVSAILVDDRHPGCRAVRVDFPQRGLVPQGLALGPGRTAYVSGYLYAPERGFRVCRVFRVDRSTGEVTGASGPIAESGAQAGSAGPQTCHHGGGLALTEDGLWLAGAGRLWLLDPDALGTPGQIKRVWTVDPRTRASTLAAGAADLLVGLWRDHRAGHVLRFPYDALLAPASRQLALEPGPGAVTPSRIRGAPSRLQGLAVDRRGTWLVRSTTYCAELVTPTGRHLPFVPGAEGVAFDRGAIWVVSESGAPVKQRDGDRPDVPTLVRVERDQLDHDDEARCW